MGGERGTLTGGGHRAVAVGRLLGAIFTGLDQSVDQRVDLLQGGRPRRTDGGRLEALVREVLR